MSRGAAADATWIFREGATRWRRRPAFDRPRRGGLRGAAALTPRTQLHRGPPRSAQRRCPLCNKPFADTDEKARAALERHVEADQPFALELLGGMYPRPSGKLVPSEYPLGTPRRGRDPSGYPRGTPRRGRDPSKYPRGTPQRGRGPSEYPRGTPRRGRDPSRNIHAAPPPDHRHHQGTMGLGQDLRRAARLYRRAAKLGRARAAVRVGLMHLEGARRVETLTTCMAGANRGRSCAGEGVRKDVTIAARYFERAASARDPFGLSTAALTSRLG